MIDIKNISKSFGDNKVLDNISFNIDKGDVISLFGVSGSGKTTLANIIAQYITPDSGEIIFDEKDTLRKDIQLISQHPYSAFNPRKTILESLEEGVLYLKLANKKNIREYLDYYIKLSCLDDNLLSRKPRELSGGELQRASIARAIAVKPKLLIADEITSSLDTITEREIAETIKSLSSTGLSILFITHNRELGKYISNRYFLLENKRIRNQN